MKKIILIDGENLIHGLCGLLSNKNTKYDRFDLINYDFRGLVKEILPKPKAYKIYWFGTKLKLYRQSEYLIQKTRLAIDFQSHFINKLQDQGINFIKAGYLRARETEPCATCKKTHWKLTEKGVDVSIAVEMVSNANKNTEIVIISADTDLLPAFKASSKLGATLISVTYSNIKSTALSKESYRTIYIDKGLAQKYITS
jgi:uncharacterized LabA/DUF88 family protein